MLAIDGLSVHFKTSEGTVEANRSVSLTIQTGETLGLMGESGCGKSVLAMSILRLQQPGRIVGGRILLDGIDLTTASDNALRSIRGRIIGLVPQDVSGALNPLHTIGFHFAEVTSMTSNGRTKPHPSFHDNSSPTNGIPETVLKAMDAVCLPSPPELLRCYPHQLSIGMKQRVLLAMVVLSQPRLLICDEPTTALDAPTKERVLGVLADCRQKSTMLLISHDAEAVRRVCDRVAVMYAGTIVESGPCEAVFRDPLHPYTTALLGCQRYERGKPLVLLPGDTPDLLSFPVGCAFHPRCQLAMDVCSKEQPPVHDLNGRVVLCHRHS